MKQPTPEFRHMMSQRLDAFLDSKNVGMQRVLRLCEGVARVPTTVLLSGESGTGKEVLARYIHTLSDRRDGPFIAINSAAIPSTLMESEFFGHERGAFSGATETRKGRFELAHGGTLLLDEISELPLGMQAKLLRVIQERQFTRVGGQKNISTDVRIIATS
ncbi:MAG TPA: sigma-54 factor interaction domain-containing protein, partial [Myxococcales bacterium]|nr:sigma-54 factor interaction domain-containing protein [Myxococcales bacterium]